jgi:hypothetical protein
LPRGGKIRRRLARDIVGLLKLAVLTLQHLQLGGDLRRHAGRTTAVALGLLEPFIERLPGAPGLGRDRDDRRPTLPMLALVIENHTNRAIAHLGRKLVRRLACHRSTFSGVGANDKPGAVQVETVVEKRMSTPVGPASIAKTSCGDIFERLNGAASTGDGIAAAAPMKVPIRNDSRDGRRVGFIVLLPADIRSSSGHDFAE